MCVYTTQPRQLIEKLPEVREHIGIPLPMDLLWLEDPEFLAVDRPEFAERSPVIGIGNWGTIMFQKDLTYFLDWAQFAPARSQWAGGKPSPYYNAKVETLEAYENGDKKGPFAKEVMDDVKHRSCIFWVNSFFESNGNKANPRWFHIQRQDNGMIPLAAFFHIMDEPHQGRAWPAFTIITRDPYDLIASTGHDRSPAILPYQEVSAWLNPEQKIRAKLDLLASSPEGDFNIDEVERFSVTKKTPEAAKPIEGGQYFAQGKL